MALICQISVLYVMPAGIHALRLGFVGPCYHVDRIKPPALRIHIIPVLRLEYWIKRFAGAVFHGFILADFIAVLSC
jgi:hypothetical protein